MKNTYIALTFLLLAAVSTLSQDRPRYYDNFDTRAGVKVDRVAAPSSGSREASANSTVRKTSTPRLASPSIGETPAPGSGTNKNLVRRTAQVTMTVYDGYAPAAEAPQAMATPRYVVPTVSSRPVMEAGRHLKGYSTGNDLYDAYIVDSSRRYNIDPLLIYAQMHQESSFKLKATSYKGASGLMQLMPATARRLGVTNIYDPKQNIEGGVKYMRMLLDMFGQDVDLALAGYNAGEGAVMKYGYQIPPYNETRDYVRRISARYRAISGASIARVDTRFSGSPATRETGPSNRYESDTVTVRTSDGKTRLINK